MGIATIATLLGSSKLENIKDRRFMGVVKEDIQRVCESVAEEGATDRGEMEA